MKFSSRVIFKKDSSMESASTSTTMVITLKAIISRMRREERESISSMRAEFWNQSSILDLPRSPKSTSPTAPPTSASKGMDLEKGQEKPPTLMGVFMMENGWVIKSTGMVSSNTSMIPSTLASGKRM